MTTKREEWTVNGAWHVVNAHGGLVADVYGSAENVRRIAAVPDMEAALMRFYKTRGCGCAAGIGQCSHCEAGAALRKAGLIP